MEGRKERNEGNIDEEEVRRRKRREERRKTTKRKGTSVDLSTNQVRRETRHISQRLLSQARKRKTD